MESQGFEEYIQGLEKENKDLKFEIKRYEKGYLGTENQMLRETIKEKDKTLFEITQENARMENKINDLKMDNQILESKIEGLEGEFEISEKLDTDKPLEDDPYSTKSLSNNLLINAIDKLADERNTYKEIINVMCDKFEIPTDAVLDILDDIQSSKGQQIEKTL